jgi:hypothetical protein
MYSSSCYQLLAHLLTCISSGNYDILQQPENISESSKDTVCFFMFLDEETEAALKNSTTIDHTKRIGLWRVVVVRNLPYSDARRNGKVVQLAILIFPSQTCGLCNVPFCF